MGHELKQNGFAVGVGLPVFPSYSKCLVCIHDAVAVGKSHCTQQVGVSSGKQQCWQIAVTWLASSNDATAATNDVEKSFMAVRYE